MDTPTVNVLSLTSGAAGLDLGVELALRQLGLATRHVAYVEIEAYACAVLVSRMEEGALAPAPLWTDLRSFDGRPLRGLVDLVVAGHPCQPWSTAGKRLGKDDPRHLWPHVRRVLEETEPSIVFLENVSGHLSLGAHEVVRELQEMGYRVAAGLYRAEEVGAPHQRERLFILAHAARIGERTTDDTSSTEYTQGAWQDSRGGGPVADLADTDGPRCSIVGGAELLDGERTPPLRDHADGCGGSFPDLGNTDRTRLEGRGVRGGERARERAPWPPGPADADRWREYLERWPGLEPAVRRGADGLAPELEQRVDRLRLLGNGVVPDQATFAFLDLWTQLVGPAW